MRQRAEPVPKKGGGKIVLKSCRYCGRIHDETFRCAARPVPKKGGGKEAAFRSGAAWQKKREAIRNRDGYFCRVCLENADDDRGRYVTRELEVHHIVPLREAWALRLDDGNLITLCRDCHERAEKGEISRDELRRLARGGGRKLPPG